MTNLTFERTSRCRSCAAEQLVLIYSFGETPLADHLSGTDQPKERAKTYPLDLLFCPVCELVQLGIAIDPRGVFNSEYPYFSGFSTHLTEHFRAAVLAMIARYRLDETSFVIEIASNDGSLLGHFLEKGVSVLGIDPSPRQVDLALAKGVTSLNAFFDEKYADRLVKEGISADLVIANNVLAHVPNPNNFLLGMSKILSAGASIVIEIPYLIDLIESCAFDTIYHQHFCYFSCSALSNLLKRNGLIINTVERTTIHGGSLRLHCSKAGVVDPQLVTLIAKEHLCGYGQKDYFASFFARIEAIRTEIVALLEDLVDDGKTIVGYGAAAKATTFLAVTGIEKYLESIVDRNTYKQGLRLDGSGLSIGDPEGLRLKPPDYLFLLAWNFADEIVDQLAWYRRQGGRIIIPIPQLKIV